MDEGGYKIRNQSAIHFITFAVVVLIAIGRVDLPAGRQVSLQEKSIVTWCWTALNIARLKRVYCSIAGAS